MQRTVCRGGVRVQWVGCGAGQGAGRVKYRRVTVGREGVPRWGLGPQDERGVSQKVCSPGSSHHECRGEGGWSLQQPPAEPPAGAVLTWAQAATVLKGLPQLRARAAEVGDVVVGRRPVKKQTRAAAHTGSSREPPAGAAHHAHAHT